MRISVTRLYRLYNRYYALFTLVKYTTIIIVAIALWISTPNGETYSKHLQSSRLGASILSHSPLSGGHKDTPLTLKSMFAASAKVKSKHNARRGNGKPRSQPFKYRPSQVKASERESNKAFVERKLREAGVKRTHVKLPDPPKGMHWL